MYSKRLRRSRVLSLAESLETRRMLANTPFTANGLPWEITSTGTSWVESENFDYGGEGVAYHDTTSANQGGAYRPNEGVDIEGPNTSTGGTYNVGYVSPGEWMKYPVKVDVAGSYV